ncbi:MAG: ATP12 family chaperone protein [Pseudomonadota bacterium]
MNAPKRFYKDVDLQSTDDGLAVTLDGKPAKTAGRNVLAAPQSLAEAIRDEWAQQVDEIQLETMPLTRMHGFVLDAGEVGRGEFIDTILQYAGTDLLCYRSDQPALAARQDAAFSPFLKRAEADGMTFVVTTGLLPVQQAPDVIDRMRKILEGRPLGEIFPRKLLTEITGSAILGLYAEQDGDAAFAAARLDETFQAEAWGRDAEAEAREKTLRRDFDCAIRYLGLQSSQ